MNIIMTLKHFLPPGPVGPINEKIKFENKHSLRQVHNFYYFKNSLYAYGSNKLVHEMILPFSI